MTADGNATGTIVMINGAPTDNNAKLFKQGAHSVFDESTLKIGTEYDTPDWSPDKAQSEMEQAITALGKNGFEGVYAANDGTAGGAIAAMKAAGIDPSDRPDHRPGRRAGRDPADHRRRAVHDDLQGDQAGGREIAAQLAVAPRQGETPDAGLTTTVNNGTGGRAQSMILDPVAVTKENVNDTIVTDGFWTAAQICTPAYEAACKAAGIQ